MTTLITSMGHALATAASDTVKVAKFVETSVLPVLKTAKAEDSTIEAVTSLVSPQAANIERAGFAVLGVVINALVGLEVALTQTTWKQLLIGLTFCAELARLPGTPQRLTAGVGTSLLREIPGCCARVDATAGSASP